MKTLILRAVVCAAALVLFAGESQAGPIRNAVHRFQERRAERHQMHVAPAPGCPGGGPCQSCECPSGNCPSRCPVQSPSGVIVGPVLDPRGWAGYPQTCPTCPNGTCKLPRRLD